MKTVYFKWLQTLLALSVGLVLGWQVFGQSKKVPELIDAKGIRERGYKYINPLLFCTGSEIQSSVEYKELKNQVAGLIDARTGAGLLDGVAFYFRDLNNGYWAGWNENGKFSPASLLKVPTMIAYYQLAENHPEILKKPILYDGSFNDNKSEHFPPENPIQPGKVYTIEQLIEAMITSSDNNATRLLHQNIDNEYLKEVYTNLGLYLPEGNDPSVDFMSAKQYSYFFRILYNATYLSREYSEKALFLLTKPDFPQGIGSGLPNNMTYAQKFGERSIYNLGSKPLHKELHDCGIVYYPDHPYLICIMTKGQNFDQLTSFIHDVSILVYKEVDKQYSK